MTAPVPDITPATGLSLRGRTALVTGASRGLGRGLSLGLAEAGADVIALSRSRAELEELVAEIRDRGGAAKAAVCDVTDPPAVDATLANLQPVDILVNNAGTNQPEPFLSVAGGTFDRIMSLNVRATFFTTQAVAARMVEYGSGGAIVNVSSQMGHVGAAQRTVYCTAKHALEGFTKALAVELAPHRIRVNSVAPTYLKTPMTEPYFADEAFLAEVTGRIPMGRLGEVDDVVGAVVFLSSDAASLITGASLLIDGGYTAQ